RPSPRTAGPPTYPVPRASQAGQGAPTPIPHPLIGPPTATISAPANNGTYNLNQSVATTFSCADSINGPGISTCADNNGTSGTTGTLHGTLDTTTAGPHTYKVTATSKDNQTASATI